MSNDIAVTALPASSPEERIAKALAIAVQYGGFGEAHHQAWAIDQMVRALTGCPAANWQQGESDEYKKLVARACAGDDGPSTYDWDTGIAP